MRFATTRLADQDIIDIYLDGVATFGFVQAEAYHLQLSELFALLVHNPRMGRMHTEVEPPVRLLPFRAHVVLYTENDGDILVLRILHGRMDWLRHLPG